MFSLCGSVVLTFVLCLFLISHIRSIFQNTRGSPWSHNWAHFSPTRTEQKIWYVHTRESTLPPPPRGACVTLVLNQKSRLHNTRKKKRRYRKTSNQVLLRRYKPDGFSHPPTTPENTYIPPVHNLELSTGFTGRLSDVLVAAIRQSAEQDSSADYFGSEDSLSNLTVHKRCGRSTSRSVHPRRPTPTWCQICMWQEIPSTMEK